MSNTEIESYLMNPLAQYSQLLKSTTLEDAKTEALGFIEEDCEYIAGVNADTNWQVSEDGKNLWVNPEDAVEVAYLFSGMDYSSGEPDMVFYWSSDPLGKENAEFVDA